MTHKRVAFQCLDKLDTVHLRHYHIGNDKVRHLRYGVFQALLTVSCGYYLITVLKAVRQIIQH